MKSIKKDICLTLACFSGVCAVAYGMANNNDELFLFGLILIIAGYLFIRKRLRDTDKNKE